ncbi:hypothetical protein AMTR_s00025p00249270 [Amborella trichopoda]|uniref:Secreted protein n=1 Tax=Amborella trichopoda TaxID=13333 RepID=W1PXK0_AMBTC|nr:hypothetical protein AMTR_s00025p00249270 [Amborella trichopoda]
MLVRAFLTLGPLLVSSARWPVVESVPFVWLVTNKVKVQNLVLTKSFLPFAKAIDPGKSSGFA